jgi:hypothetical protein
MATDAAGEGSRSCSRRLLDSDRRTRSDVVRVEDSHLHRAFSALAHSDRPNIYPVAERLAAKAAGRTVRSFEVRRNENGVGDAR